ncbi:MAG: SpoIIE family protein phosphatase [candidate division Zixibacteria bacterium]|nr:SpoIIE family protein phosphatase [candidate division Zixibacteria bacterium]
MTDKSSKFNQDHPNIIPDENKNYTFERLLIESSHILNRNLELTSLLKNILNILTDYLGAEASAILLTKTTEDYSELFTFIAGKDIVHEVHIPEEDNSIARLVLEKKMPLIINEKELTDELKDIASQRIEITARNLMASPIIRRDKYLGVIEVFNKRDGNDFDENDLEIMSALGDQIALAVANAKLIRRTRRKTSEAQSLYEVGKLMSGTLELEELLQLIVEQLSRLVKVDVAAIYIVNPEDGSIESIVSKGVSDQIKPKLSLKIGQGICGLVAKTGESMVVNDVSSSQQYVSMRTQTKSEIAVPLRSRGKVLGVFNIESDELEAYGKADLELLEAFASQAAVSVERAILYRQAMEQKALEDELAVARKIQETFLPNNDPEVEGFDIAGVNIPSEAVGGDYYDFIDIVDNQIGIAIGDVSGKGIGAALIMAAFRASLKAEIRNNYGIRTIFKKVNSLLYESIERENYVTAVYGVLDTKNRVFTFSNAGHNPPLLFKTDGRIIELSEGGLVLGMFPESNYEERPIYINKGDILLFYTDGVTEAQDIDDREFGVERLKEFVENSRKLSPKEIIEIVIKEVQKFKERNKPLDDLTMILAKCL